ncbi:Eco57I restriction-modification methylase domain-containing protein [Paenibacillus sp. NPDC056933]|uniref:Eco57I restriction-modification methylase domain-containing protein n=1 Tax=Paenibacillus sp. NPDC056933 TaxID=3345968 RepID=UPI00362E2BD3
MIILNVEEKNYITQASEFLKSLNLENNNNFYTFYLVVYFHQYKENFKSISHSNNIDLKLITNEAKQKVSKELFGNFTLNEEDNDIFKWIVKNPPPFTDGVDILGSIYLVSSPFAHRKKLGEHYTRPDLADFIVEKYFQEYQTEEDLLSLKIIDPSCGSGNFLIAIIRSLVSKVHDKKKISNFINSYNLIGIDIQTTACLIAKVRILMEFIRQEIPYSTGKRVPILENDALLDESETLLKDSKYDLVITNPPYLRLQLIEQSYRNLLEERYQSATGRYDLYTLFIEKSIKLAKKKKGKAIILCSDKFMTSSYGRGVREFVKENANLSEVIDLSRIFPFEAAVISSVYFFDKSTEQKPILGRMEFVNNELQNSYIGEVSVEGVWRYNYEGSEDTFQKIINSSEIQLKDITRIFVGIKTTADSVFIKNFTVDNLKEMKLEEELMFPLLRGINVRRWSYSWSGNQQKKETFILYPYIKDDMGNTIPINLEEFPYVEKYLLDNRTLLESRKYFEESSKSWFELWVPHSHKTFQMPKIITPDISSKNSFALDSQGYFCTGSLYGIQFRDENRNLDDYKYLLGILNSEIIEFFHKKANPNKIHSHKYRFQTGTMKNYPIIFLAKDDKKYRRVVELVNLIVDEMEVQKKIALEASLNEVIYSIYNLDIFEVKLIKDYLMSSQNTLN